MVGVMAAILLPWGKGQENHKDMCPDTAELLNQNQQPPISGLIILEQ